MNKNFSLVVLYSKQRLRQLQNCLQCWSDVSGYEACEKILVSDGSTNIRPKEWTVLEVVRSGRFYCWANTLNTGVQACSHDTIFYLDSDRIVECNFFEMALNELGAADGFAFPKYLYTVKDFNADVNDLRKLRDNPDAELLIADHRTTDPNILNKKNPLAGCVGFHKQTFLAEGGFDPRFRGWGYPDYDFFMRIMTRGVPLLPLESVELHQRHEYECDRTEFELHSIWNCHQYLKKWQLDEGELRKRLSYFGVRDQHLDESQSLEEFLASIHQP